MPIRSHGTGLRCWSQPADVSVRQQVVPGPCRFTNATNKNGSPAPDKSPNVVRRVFGLKLNIPATNSRAAIPSVGNSIRASARIAPAGIANQ